MRIPRLIAGLLLVAACAGNPPAPSSPASPSASATAATASPTREAPTASTIPASEPPAAELHLLAALGIAPAEMTMLEFTDWSLMLAADGVTGRADEMSDEQRRTFLGSIFRRHARPSAFAFHKIHAHREAWGWDNTDLAWEATVHVGTDKVHVLRLPDHLPMADVEARFEDYGFARDERGSAFLFSTRLDSRAEWLRSSDPAMRNSALLPAGRLLLVSSSAELLERTVDTALGRSDSALRSAAVEDAATRAGELIGALVLAGKPLCKTIGPSWLLPEDREWLLSFFPELHEPEAIVVGYRYDNDSPLGIVALGYPNASHAREDLAMRMVMADGPALNQWVGLEELDMSDLYFGLTGGRTEGSTIVLEAAIVEDRPEHLMTMVYSGDVLFAMC